MVGAGQNNTAIAAQLATSTQDSAEPHFQHHDKASCLRPGPGHHPGAYGRFGVADRPRPGRRRALARFERDHGPSTQGRTASTMETRAGLHSGSVRSD